MEEKIKKLIKKYKELADEYLKEYDMGVVWTYRKVIEDLEKLLGDK